MDPATTVEVDSGECAVTPEAVLDALQHVISDVGVFLTEWCYRAEQNVMTRDRPATPESVLRQRIAEFQAERNLWEAKRQAEEHKIRKKVEELTEAWLQLEEEQRSFLQTKETQTSGRDRSSAAHEQRVPSHQERHAETPQPHHHTTPQDNHNSAPRIAFEQSPAIHAASGEPEGTMGCPQIDASMPSSQAAMTPASAPDQQALVQAAASHVNRSRESAVVQFQRLRREIESSRTHTG